jgi:pimeloyl-ACP methyl ester carboxylesterase
MRTAVNDNVELPFDVEGTGPDLLLIAGTASTRAIWSLVRPELARSFRTIAFDNRDSCESTIASQQYGIHDLARDALAVLEAAGSARAHVLGHSMGGVVAQELALSHGSRIASLTLVSTWGRGDAYSRNVMELMSSLTAGIVEDRTLLAAILFAGAGTTTLRNESLFDMVDAAMALGPLAPRSGLLRQWHLGSSVDTLARLGKLIAPVHVMWGDEDRLLPPWFSEQLVAAMPHAHATPMPACGHLPMVVAPEAFTQAVTAFLSRAAA